MAVARTARIDAIADAGEARVFDATLGGEDSLGFVGGQYVIVDTGVDLPSGKRAKRAYSIVSSDADQRAFRIVVKRIAGGPGSAALHALEPGGTLTFSGPWGKYMTPPAPAGRALVFATDTGITAALGLLRGAAFAPLRSGVRLVWYTPGDGDFVGEAFVREQLGALAEVVVEPALPVGHPERTSHALSVARRHADGIDAAFLSGDGAVVHPAREALLAAGLSEGSVVIESFFNNPARKAP
jgi:ferredoxin-NADP reductase